MAFKGKKIKYKKNGNSYFWLKCKELFFDADVED